LQLFDDPVPEIQDKAIEALEMLHVACSGDLINVVATTLEGMCVTSHVRAFERPEGFESIVPIIEQGFLLGTQASVKSACTLLVSCVPQLRIPPISTRKLVAKLIWSLEEFPDVASETLVLNGLTALFDKSTTERQFLCLSLPVCLTRVFGSGSSQLDSISSSLLVKISQKTSRPMNVVRCFLRVIRENKSDVGYAVNGLSRSCLSLKLTVDEVTECLGALEPLLRNADHCDTRVLAQAIATVLHRGTREFLLNDLQNRTLITPARDPEEVNLYKSMKFITMNIMTELLFWNRLEVLPLMEQFLPVLQEDASDKVRDRLPVALISMIMADNGMLEKLLGKLLVLCEEGTAEQRVHACAELSKLQNVSNWSEIREKTAGGMVLNCLMRCNLYGPAGVDSAAAKAAFDLFVMDELDTDKKKKKLASRVRDDNAGPDGVLEALEKIISQVQNDRKNETNRT
jgi:hypothetical protein